MENSNHRAAPASLPAQRVGHALLGQRRGVGSFIAPTDPWPALGLTGVMRVRVALAPSTPATNLPPPATWLPKTADLHAAVPRLPGHARAFFCQMRGGRVVRRLAHNQEVGGANPPPATNFRARPFAWWYSSEWRVHEI